MSHINKVRQRILKNNEALAAAESSAGSKDTKGNGKGKGKSTALGSDAGDRAKAASTSTERETRDQGFTRPKVLILAPFRNSALEWMRHLTHFSLASQIENNARFQRDFSLPEGAVDKLATDEKDADGASKYPRSHRETFKGNIDDSFRVGLKVTRKSLKLYSEFYQSDLIIASPLGLRMSIEKEKWVLSASLAWRSHYSGWCCAEQI
jgi:U3 small nucleolar RNA-associated protein 25